MLRRKRGPNGAKTSTADPATVGSQGEGNYDASECCVQCDVRGPDGVASASVPDDGAASCRPRLLGAAVTGRYVSVDMWIENRVFMAENRGKMSQLVHLQSSRNMNCQISHFFSQFSLKTP